MSYPLRASDPSRLGSVEDVNGSSISVKLSEATPSGVVFVGGEAYRVGQVGGFVRIPAGYLDLFGVISQVGAGAAPGPPEAAPQLGNRWLRVELVGEGRRGATFQRGISQYPSIGDSVHVVTESDLHAIYAPGSRDGYVAVGRVASAESIRCYVDANRLVARHSAVVGATGAGKSSTVAALISKLAEPNRFPASRIVVFDAHGEYTKAFGSFARVFRVGADQKSGERDLYVPFWALTFDEFLSLAMGSVSGIPLTLVQERVLDAKRRSMPGGVAHGMSNADVTIDTPLPFSVHSLWYDLYATHYGTHTVSGNQNQSEATRAFAKDAHNVTLNGDADKVIRPVFKPENKTGDDKIYLGQHSNLPKAHVDVLEMKLRDPRLQFLFSPGKWAVAPDGSTQNDLDALLSEWVGANAPISIFDLSGIPPAIVDDLVGAILRIIYDALFWGRTRPEGGKQRPLLIILEEAHAYLGSQAKGRAAVAARRVAKEGRKYGVGMMLVSQRPAEIDGTILAQCGTVFALRLTNDTDKGHVTSCASDNLKGLFSMLPILRTGEALIVGEAVNLPIRAVMDRPEEGNRPDSDDPMVAVPKGASGKPIKPGGWNVAVGEEDYGAVVKAWRTQDTPGGV